MREQEFTKHSNEVGQPLYEATGLAWLGDGGVTVPEVLQVTPTSLTTRKVEDVGPSREGALELGRMLALLHASGAPWFGAPPPEFTRAEFARTEFARRAGRTFVDGWMGRAPLPLLAKPERDLTWGRFYAEYRIRPYLSGVFTEAQKREVEGLCALLDAGTFGHPQPKAVRDAGHAAARLHGDLWAGNVMWSAGLPTLIDPAAQGGHAETDLAMLHTFGAPHLREILVGYQQVSPLYPGWERRVDLHKLHILVVHCYLFGGPYVAEFMECVRKTRALVR